MAQKVAILDYGTGNLHSVSKKLTQLKTLPVLCNHPKGLGECDKIILPGVGHFASAMQHLQTSNLLHALQEAVLVKQKPVLGICLGLQIMALSSAEAPEHKGLGWLNTQVVKFSQADNQAFRTPHTGWNTLSLVRPNLLFQDIRPTDEFFFTHAYHLSDTAAPFVSTQTHYGYLFAAAIQQNNIYGVQFHPEKSHAAGETVLKNFLSL